MIDNKKAKAKIDIQMKRSVFIVLSSLTIYFLVIYLLASLLNEDVSVTWRFFGVPPLPSLFADLRIITSAVGTDLPFEVLATQNVDAAHYNYPRIWLILGRLLQVSEGDTIYLSVLVIIVFFYFYFLVFKEVILNDWRIFLLYLLSPAVMLAVSRANSDLIVFVVIVASIWFSNRKNSLLLPSGLVLASSLKLYPLLSFIVLLKNKNYLSFFIVSGIFIISFWILRSDFLILAKTTPRGFNVSFGLFVFLDYLKNYFPAIFLIFPYTVMKLVCVFFGILLPVFFYFRMQKNYSPLTFDDSSRSYLFIVGSAAYACAFLIGNCFDYRLIFLHLTIPYLLYSQHTNNIKSKFMILAWLILAVSWSNLFVSNFQGIGWYRPIRFFFTIVEEAAQWVIYASLGAILIYYLRGVVSSVIPVISLTRR
jgi:hypothetical protein